MCPETRCFLLEAILFFFTKQLLSQDSMTRCTSRPTTLEFCMGLFDTKGHFQTSCNIFPTVFLNGGHKTTFLDNEFHTLLNWMELQSAEILMLEAVKT